MINAEYIAQEAAPFIRVVLVYLELAHAQIFTRNDVEVLAYCEHSML
jgi:hypothetical protein